MKLEIELAREQFAAGNIGTRDTPPEIADVRQEVTARRALLRRQLTRVIQDALLKNSLIDLAIETPRLAQVTAGTAIAFGTVPTLQDFVIGCKELLEDAHKVTDNSLWYGEWDQLRVGIAMMEIVWRGIEACLGYPHEELMRQAHAEEMPGGPAIDKEAYRALLARAGISVPPSPAANDG